MAPEWNCFIPRLLLVTPVAVTSQLNLILCLGRCLVRCVGIIGGPLCQAIKVVSWDEMPNSCIQCVCYLCFGLFAGISIVYVISCDLVSLRWLNQCVWRLQAGTNQFLHSTWPRWKKLSKVRHFVQQHTQLLDTWKGWRGQVKMTMSIAVSGSLNRW